MELFELKGVHIMTGKGLKMVFLVRRRKSQRPIDAILDVFDLGGVHVTGVVKIPASRLPKVIAVQVEGSALVGRR